jgi:hypothetical protein
VARHRRWLARGFAAVVASAFVRIAVPWWCGRDAAAWLADDRDVEDALAEQVIAFETDDAAAPATDRFTGEWALVTHQMTALGLAQLCLRDPAQRARLAPLVTRAATRSFAVEMRGFGTRAWRGEDAMASLDGDHGHAYLAYAALALGMARLVDPAFPPELAAQHDALIAAYERRLLASPTGLIETYPGEAYPTDVAAVAAAIAIHGRATRVSHAAVLQHWAERVVAVQLDRDTGLVVQRMDAATAVAHDAPRASGTALAAYFAGFADRAVATRLATAVIRQQTTAFGFGAIREYAAGSDGPGDVDSGPVVLGVSVSATGFALASARRVGDADAFTALYRTVDLFGLPLRDGDRLRFATGGPIGNALLLALLGSGPEVAP